MTRVVGAVAVAENEVKQVSGVIGHGSSRQRKLLAVPFYFYFLSERGFKVIM